MQVRSSEYIRARPATPCAQCGKTLFSPEWSDYLNRRQVRHLWFCSSCGYDFETLVVFPAEDSDRRDDEAA